MAYQLTKPINTIITKTDNHSTIINIAQVPFTVQKVQYPIFYSQKDSIIHNYIEKVELLGLFITNFIYEHTTI